ncbi:MAG: hypothetical protein H3C38_05265 [Rhodospirillales bacterium]|nr:hypothetical protein [Rhodospirillales bacterium]
MAFNPLSEKGIPMDRQFRNWSELAGEPYDKASVHPYTRCRIITMNGVEIESILHGHQYARHTPDLDLKRQLAEIRRVEQQQQKAVSGLIPGEETILENTIGYEQVAVDLTAWVAQQEPDAYARQCYEFGLLEDFDHLYRYANLLDLLEHKKADDLVGKYTEIIPGRPTKLEHRHPFDDVRKPLDHKTADPLSLMHALTITAAEQQTMNFYMNVANRPTHPVARALYVEIGMIEEQHVTQYESLLDPTMTWAQMEVMHHYNECYLYYSFLQQEEDPRVRQMWDTHLAMEIEHLRLACELMKKVDRADPAEMLPQELPEPVKFQANKEFVRKVLGGQITLTADGTDFVPMDKLPADHRYSRYQSAVHGGGMVPSEAVIEEHKSRLNEEYRLNTEGPHPVEWLRRQRAAE